MAKMNPSPKPTFFWQGALILLPVAVMAAFGFWAILRQRNVVERDAQQRAQGILQILPAEFGRNVASRLTDFDASKNGWFNYLELGLAARSEDVKSNELLDNTNGAAVITREVADLKAAFPDWKSGAPPIVDFIIETNGELRGLRPMPPRPPAWLAGLSARQYRAWAALERADYAGSLSNVVALAAAFEKTEPPAPARVCAEFIRLRARSRTQPATNAVHELIDFALQHTNIKSDSGLPLTTLAVAESLNRARECGPTTGLWEALRREVADPGALTPSLLDEAANLVARDPQQSKSIGALRILLSDKQSQQELADAVERTGKLNGTTTTNLWVNALGRRWFCILQPETVDAKTALSNRPVHRTTVTTKAACFPKSLVAREFAGALREAGISLPNYFGLAVELEGEPVALPVSLNLSGDGKPGEVLAQRPFRMSQMATGVNHVTGRREDRPFDDMPGHPQFTLRVFLANRSLLYAKQRQLQFIFGSLIAFAALTALIGFVAAWRSFHRQRQLAEMKSNFVSSVSHELRAPIASVRLMAENLEGGKIPDAPRQSEYFRFIVQECRRLSSLIENVLDFSRIEQGRKQYEFEPTDAFALVQSSMKLMEPSAAEKGIKLQLQTSNIQLPTPNTELNLDGRAIQQALVNLIDNAIKHSPKGETVTVNIAEHPAEPSRERVAQTALLRTPHSALRISVTDHGPGIPREEQEKIFERFYRFGSELRRETQGAGIGLSIVKHIAQAHGGSVTVQSEPGKGSRFTIELPLEK